jgi:monofunctional biosynthetic peptidoglycan transglycosylase
LKRVAVTVVLVHGVAAALLLLLRFVNPPTTGIQIQRRVEGIVGRASYEKRATFVPLRRIAPSLRHAVIAAEDGRFYQHYGIDWEEVQRVAERSADRGELPPRGASTIPQQLVKNLFFTTHRNPLRKVLELTLAPMAVVILGRERLLELYLNVVEWGPGVFGAEAAAQYHYRTSSARLDRDQAARLAAVLPAPRQRRPSRMNDYSAIILARMQRAGW